jgi:DNA-binding transcriptional ArsR family regulator
MTMTIFEVLAEPSRRRILELLRQGEQPAGAFVEDLGLAQPTVSQHLRILRTAGLVSVRPEAQRRLYRLRREGLREVDEWLAPFRSVWAERLDELERHLDTMEDE